MIINFSNLGGGGGGSYVLPTATDSRLGGVKIGSGVNVDSAGTISVDEYELSAATQNTLGGVKIGSGITVDSAGTISAQEYTLPTASSEVLGGVKVGSGLTITDGVLSANGGEGGDSTALEEITELPENPVDGAVYNYNGVLVKYVNGAGNWGYWDGISVTKAYDRAMKNSATLFYGVIPASMEGELAFGLGHIVADPANTKLWAYFNLSGDTIDIYDNSGKTGSTLYSIQRNAGSQTHINNSSILAYISWDDGVIQINFDSHYDQLMKYCDTSISTAHYELEQSIQRKYTISRDLTEPTYLTQPPYYLSQFDTKSGVAHPGTQLFKSTIYINNSGYSNGLTYWGNSAPIQRMFVPTASGETGSLLVSQGNAAPVFKTVSQALGVDFWTGTQAEYDAIVTKSATTLYIIIPE